MAGSKPKSARPVGNSGKGQRPANGEISHGARAIASDVLNRCDPKRNYAAPILDELLKHTARKQRATDLVFGTLRNHSAIDTVVVAFSSRPVERIQAKLLNIIRIAVYELIYSPKTPQYSIVNEAVENAKTLTGAPAKREPNKQTGFVNAVLREITRNITNRQTRLTKANEKAALPQTLATGCAFVRDFLPDPKAAPADYLSTAFSLPEWLITDWLGEFGFEKTRQICFASNRRPGIYIRPNTLKTTTQELAEKFHQADIDCEIVPPDTQQASKIQHRLSAVASAKAEELGMIKIKSPRAIMQLPGFAEGLFVVQDISASQAVRILDPQPGWKILDLCAAPGVKTTQLAEVTGDAAVIVATDIDGERLKLVEENITRLGIKSVSVVTYENLEEVLADTVPFDAILLDVPCSNTGVLAKRIEARYRIKPQAIKQLAKVQSELLSTAAQMVKPNGKICYSTCSIQKAENSEVIACFLQQNRTFKLESEKLTLPSAEEFGRDGGYVAIITRG